MWQEIDAVFENRILIDAIINGLYRAATIFRRHQQCSARVSARHNCIKVNIISNGELATGHKHANKSNTKNTMIKILFQTSNLREWYVIALTLAFLEEFQKREWVGVVADHESYNKHQ